MYRHTNAEASDDKLSDMMINNLRTVGSDDMAESVMWLKCGPCSTYFKQDRYFVANGGLKALNLISACSVFPTGPFFTNQTAEPFHFGLSCDRYTSAYSEARMPGCFCGGTTGHAGALYVRAADTSQPQALLQVTASADSSVVGHRAGSVLDGSKENMWLSTANTSEHWIELDLGDGEHYC